MPALKLTLVSYQGRPCESEARRLDGARLTIGRGAECDWELRDDSRELSRTHCAIEPAGGGYTIIDLSANGVYLNDAAEPLGRDVSAPLGDRDEIAIGPYRIRAELEAAPPDRPAMAAVDPFRTADEAAPSWFSSGPPSPGGLDVAAAPIGSQWPSGDDPFSHENYRSPLPNSNGGWSDPDPFAAPQPAPGGGDFAAASALNVAVAPPEIQQPVIPTDWNFLEPEKPPNPQPIVEPVRPPTPVSAPSPAGGDALCAFLQGAGLNEPALPPGDELAQLRQFGEMFREMAAAIHDLLAARSLVKADFHVPQTLIAGRDNNPFKFSVGVDDLLAKLLGRAPSGYAMPLPAIREAVLDLQEHDLALLAAMQETVYHLLDHLSPHALQGAADAAGVFGNLLPAARKAAWWDAFEQAHRRAVEGVEVDIPGGFRQKFAESYAAQAKRH